MHNPAPAQPPSPFRGFLSVLRIVVENLYKLLSKTGVFILSTMVGLYLIRKYVSSAFYFGYFSGFISCIVFEILFCWKFFAFKLQDRIGSSKSMIEIAKFKYESAFGDDSNDKKIENAIKKGYFINEFSSETRMMKISNLSLSRTGNDQSNKRAGAKFRSGSKMPLSPSTKTNYSDLKLAKSMPLSSNRKEEMLNRFDPDNLALEPILLKIHSEEFTKKVNLFATYLNELIQFEENYAKALQLVGQPKFLSNENILFSTAEYSRFQPVLKSELSEVQKKSLEPYITLRESIASLEISMPEWKIFKKALNHIGKIHSDCANFLRDGSNSLINMMSIEYVNNCKEIKKQKKIVGDEMQSCRLHYTKVKGEHDATEENVKILRANYLEATKNKENWNVIFKLENQLKLTLGKLNNLKAKVADAKDKLKECYLRVNFMNNQIEEFQNHWEEIRVKYFSTTLRGMISGYENAFLDTKLVLEEILNYKFLIERKSTSPKSLMKSLSFHPEKEAEDLKIKINDSQLKIGINETLDKKSSRMSVGDNSVNDPYPEMNDSKQQIDKVRLSSSDLPSFLRNQKAEISMKNDDDKELMKLEEGAIIKHVNEVYERINSWFEEQKNQLINFEKFYKGAALLFKELVGYEENHRHNLYYKFNAGDLLNKEDGQLLFMWKNFKYKMGECTHAIKFYIKSLKSLESQCYVLIKRLENERTAHHKTCALILKKYSSFAKKLLRDYSEKLANTKKEKFHEETHFVNQELNRICIKEKNLFEAEMTVHLFKSGDILNENTVEMAKIKMGLVQYLIDHNAHQLKAVKELITIVDQVYQSDSATREDGGASESGANDIVVPGAGIEDVPNSVEKNAPRENSERKGEDLREEASFDELDKDNHYKQNHKINMDELLNSENFIENIHMPEPLGKGGCECFTRLFGVFFSEWSKNHYFREKMKRELNESFNKKRPSALGEIKVVKLELDGVGPEIRDIVPQKSHSFEFLYDLDISYRGKINLEIQSKVHINWPSENYATFPLYVGVLIQSLNGKIRLCYVPTRYGKSWYSFIGEPVIHMSVDPVIGMMSINKFPQAPDIIKDLIQRKIRKMTYPNRVTLKIPVAKLKNLKPYYLVKDPNN